MQNKPSRILWFQSWISRKANVITAGFVVIFLVTGILTLPNYGLTWNEGLGNLFFGERYLHYFKSLNPVNLDFAAELSYNQDHPLNLFNSPYRDSPEEFPPVADTLSAATMYLFSYTLGWVNPIDGFHAFTVILAAIFLWVLYLFAAPRLGRFEAFLAVAFLGLFPRFWGDMHFNNKNVPETIFFGLVMISYISWMEKPGWRKAILTGVLGGMALGTKANAIFIPVILLIGLLPWNFDAQSWKNLWVHLKQYVGQYLSMILAAAIFYIASWPYLYADPYNHLKSYWSYIFSQGDRSGEASFNIDSIRQVLFSMPEIMLVALLIGIVLALTKIKEPFWRILIAWLVFPILRASLPGMVNFDGIRHFLEFIPAAALLAGYGIGRASAWLSTRKISMYLSRAIFGALLLFNMLGIYLTYFPYLHIYYNQLSGGLAGARNGWLGADAGDYWASSYRQGMAWLSQNTPEGSMVRGMTAGWLVELSAPVFLRPDQQVMTLKDLPDFTTLEKSETPIYLMFAIRDGSDFLDKLAYCQNYKPPAYQIIVDDVPILQIFKFGKNIQ